MKKPKYAADVCWGCLCLGYGYSTDKQSKSYSLFVNLIQTM